jgi:hypothetical protein
LSRDLNSTASLRAEEAGRFSSHGTECCIPALRRSPVSCSPASSGRLPARLLRVRDVCIGTSPAASRRQKSTPDCSRSPNFPVGLMNYWKQRYSSGVLIPTSQTLHMLLLPAVFAWTNADSYRPARGMRRRSWQNIVRIGRNAVARPAPVGEHRLLPGKRVALRSVAKVNFLSSRQNRNLAHNFRSCL